jgi:hypothetical protein
MSEPVQSLRIGHCGKRLLVSTNFFGPPVVVVRPANIDVPCHGCRALDPVGGGGFHSQNKGNNLYVLVGDEFADV